MKNATRTPLGQALTGEIRRSGNLVFRSCGDNGTGLHLEGIGRGDLSIEGLHLTVMPRERNVFERALRFLGLTRSLDRSIDLLAEDCDDSNPPRMEAHHGDRAETGSV